MFRSLASLLCCFGLAVCSSGVIAAEQAPNSLSDAEVAAGWKLLFDGQTTTGWRNYKQKQVSDGWQVADGAINRVGKAGDIVTTQEYAAFELVLDFKISKGGNSGVMYHVQETGGAPWQTGPEIQIQDNKEGHDPQKCGWLYQLYKSDVDATNPAGEWNTLRVVITPEKCEHYMNGKKYCEYVKGSADWDAAVAKSKFGKMPGFGKATTGLICLQDHGNPVSYRNIKIREIK